MDLTLRHVRISEQELIESLALMPSLTALALSNVEVGNDTIHQLTVADALPNLLLPKLATFDLSLLGQVLFKFDALTAMVSSRGRREAGLPQLLVVPLEGISVHIETIDGECPGLPTAAALARFEKLKEGGVSVLVKVDSE